jgi:hypothetical protein
MIDAVHLKSHCTVANLLEKGIFLAVSDAQKADLIPDFMRSATANPKGQKSQVPGFFPLAYAKIFSYVWAMNWLVIIRIKAKISRSAPGLFTLQAFAEHIKSFAYQLVDVEAVLDVIDVLPPVLTNLCSRLYELLPFKRYALHDDSRSCSTVYRRNAKVPS